MSKNNKGNGRNEPWRPVDPSAASDGDIHRVHDELVDKKESPREGFSPIPIFLVLLISGLIVFSGIYMVWRSDDFDQMGYDETRRRFAWADLPPRVEEDPFIRQGRIVYTQCAACHQPNGQGVPGAFPPLDSTRWVVGNEDRLIKVVMHGLIGPIEVKGNSYNGVMPNLGLSDPDIAAVLSYMRQAWSNDAPPIAVEEVTRVREETGPRGMWDAAELLEQYPLEDPAQLEEAADEAAEEEEAAEDPGQPDEEASETEEPA